MSPQPKYRLFILRVPLKPVKHSLSSTFQKNSRFHGLADLTDLLACPSSSPLSSGHVISQANSGLCHSSPSSTLHNWSSILQTARLLSGFAPSCLGSPSITRPHPFHSEKWVHCSGSKTCLIAKEWTLRFSALSMESSPSETFLPACTPIVLPKISTLCKNVFIH